MRNLIAVLRETCRNKPHKTAFLVKKNGTWNPVTWSEFNMLSDQIAAGLLSMGFKPGDAISILGETRLEWTLADLGALKAGCVSVGIYQTL